MGWLADFLVANKFWLQVVALVAVMLGASILLPFKTQAVLSE